MDNNKQFFDFLLRKEFCFDEIMQDLSDRWREDEFNCEYAEKALDIACDLYPDGSESEDALMDKRHEFVSDFLEHMRCEVTKTWASNLGMVTIEKAQENANAQAAEAVKMYKKQIELQAKNFRNMSAYQFAEWKLSYDAFPKMENPNPFGPMPSEDHIVQDSEDEAWEQLMAFQRANFKDV